MSAGPEVVLWEARISAVKLPLTPFLDGETKRWSAPRITSALLTIRKGFRETSRGCNVRRSPNSAEMLIASVQLLAAQHKVALEPLGDLDTLPARIHAEVAASNSVVSFVPLVGAWSRTPA